MVRHNFSMKVLIDCPYIFKIILFGIGVHRGNPYRILKGTDVAGNVCGKKNDKIDGVKYSGQNLEENE